MIAVESAQQKAQHFGGVGDSATGRGQDPGLARLLEVWSELTDAVKNRVLRIVDEAACTAR